MKKLSRTSRPKQLPTIIFVIAGLIVLGVTGFLLSDPGRRLWEPQSEAAVPCTYGSYAAGTCNNTACTTALGTGNLGNKCASPNPKSGTGVVTKCKIIGERETIVDCCRYGSPSSSGVCSGTTPTATPTPTRTPTPTATPTAFRCTAYGTYTKNSCSNTNYCPSGRYCAARTLSGASSTKCLSRTATSDQILDCCPSGQVINGAGTACVIIGPTTPVPTPTKAYCNEYGSHPKNTCSNTSCSQFGTGLDCRNEWVGFAIGRKCLNESSTDVIKDCCAPGSVVRGSSGNYYCDATTSTVTPTATRTPSPTATSTPNPTASRTPSPTASRTPSPTATGTPAPTGTVTSTATPSPTGTATPSITPQCTRAPLPSGCQYTSDECTNTEYTCNQTPTPSVTIPPTTVARTPSVTHTPSETGFADNVLLYIGGALYTVGVFAFVGARYVNVARRPKRVD